LVIIITKTIPGMKMKNLLTFILLLLTFNTFAQEKTLLIRCDDMGMSHSVNVAFEELFKTGIPVSASVMFACPWYIEAVDILKKYSNVSIGIHLTLNSEWRNYKWGPVTGRTAVPSLVDKNGHFFPSRTEFFANNPVTDEVEMELRAQVERAVKTGLTIDYVDYHMGTAMDRPEYRDIVEKIANEYNLGISRFYKETYANNMYFDPIEHKEDSLYYILTNTLSDTTINLLVCHIGMDDPELRAMEDQNAFGLKEMSRHRNAELNALLSERIMKLFASGSLKLINYSSLKSLAKIRPPEFVY
jgi:chitin disaccharide deacetylase